MSLRLVIFDVDGTISDSQSHIHYAMSVGFEAVGQVPPPLAQVRSIVGLSLPQAVAELAPALPLATRDAIVAAYKASWQLPPENRSGDLMRFWPITGWRGSLSAVRWRIITPRNHIPP
jgi:phosphoglycolate phosphatase-like HAD superfamily hydrolase